MARIPAGISELKVSHQHLSTASKHLIAKSEGGQHAPAYLLLFYAAECGLKSAYLRRNKLQTTAQLLNNDHDLQTLIKELRVSASVLGNPPSLRLARRQRETCSHTDAHQAWRYGLRIEPADEGRFVAWLQKICEILKDHL